MSEPKVAVDGLADSAKEAGLPKSWIKSAIGCVLLYLFVTRGFEGIGFWHLVVAVVAWEMLSEHDPDAVSSSHFGILARIRRWKRRQRTEPER